MQNTMVALLGFAILTNSAIAEDRLDDLKKINTEMCIRAGAHVAGAPSDAKLTEPYCNCVTQAYWESVPKSEVAELMAGGSSLGIRTNQKARMDAAKSACKKKLSF